MIVTLYLNPKDNPKRVAKTIAETGKYPIQDRHTKKHYEDVYENAIIHYDFATYKLTDFLNKFYYNQNDDCDSMALIQ